MTKKAMEDVIGGPPACGQLRHSSSENQPFCMTCVLTACGLLEYTTSAKLCSTPSGDYAKLRRIVVQVLSPASPKAMPLWEL